MYLSGLGITSLHTKSFCHPLNTLTDKADIYTKEKT